VKKTYGQYSSDKGATEGAIDVLQRVRKSPHERANGVERSEKIFHRTQKGLGKRGDKEEGLKRKKSFVS